VAPRGAQYTDRLEGSVRLAQKLVGIVRCGVWVVVIVTCDIINTIDLPNSANVVLC
jgi:hypothetical protein